MSGDAPTPWVGLVALGLMFVLPLLPAWFWEGRPRSRRRPQGRVEILPPLPPEGDGRIPAELLRLDGDRVPGIEGRRGRSS